MLCTLLQGRVDMVEYLVRTAAVLELDLNHVDHDGANVLFYCAASGRLNLLRLLLKVIFIPQLNLWTKNDFFSFIENKFFNWKTFP